MTTHWHDVRSALRGPAIELREAMGETWQHFSAMSSAAVKDGAIPGRIKEVIALTLAVSKQCDGCIASHARAAARKGATPEEVAEGLAVALSMGGGPATVYGPRAWEAYQEFVSEIADA
jgi:AhpD family alkylhydroperoxidase